MVYMLIMHCVLLALLYSIWIPVKCHVEVESQLRCFFFCVVNYNQISVFFLEIVMNGPMYRMSQDDTFYTVLFVI